MEWKAYRFNELTINELHDIFRLRVNVFVVEQNCAYPEVDGLDPHCTHLVAKTGGRIAAYARLVPGGLKGELPAIGRVIVVPEARGTGLGRELVQRSRDFIINEWEEKEIFLQGQSHLEAFYASLGFESVSAEYLDDGIPHIDMKFSKN
ncbi:GNAT family N-acetyltransferase [Planococcus lenghuensis]|uniref:GNAT family N-acetyltransferase n=1 Tax=Planococcus lenghuensis TaxID=2213202 RepID=A0A1Q2KWC7_9BACL|nr:GNAT family N-acetyltransferase [Planococcus lenghuensis]AQQ52107.1 GNAT family N-acetyltransferase [Planococcus lenghuensis]